MLSASRWAAAVVLLACALAPAQEGKYAAKAEKEEPPKELAGPVRKLIGDESVKFTDAKGEVIAQVWLRKEIPAEATPEQVKNGLTYREIPQTTLVGAIRIEQRWTDYKKQVVKPGVYTLRMAFQPENGDHMGTAPFPEFFLLLAANKDENPGTLEPEKLFTKSGNAIGTSHPAVMLLFPNNKPGAAPSVATKNVNHVVLNTKGNITVKGKAAGQMGFGLTLVGHGE